MITRNIALIVLLASLPSFSQTISAPQEKDFSESESDKQAKDREQPIKIVKYLDFTKSEYERSRLSLLDDNQKNAVEKSAAIAEATSYEYTVRGKTYQTLAHANDFKQEGTASWYGPGFHGKKTASGEIFDQNELTAAHKRLPLGTKIRVTNLENGKSVVVKINDRGPFHSNRVLDLSQAAAQKIGLLHSGVTNVSIVTVK